MVEAYAFFAAFAVQILAMSVVLPAWYIRYVRAQATSFPAERFAQRYPGVDHNKILECYLTWHRLLNTGIAVLGLFLLAWLFRYMQRPDWDDGPVEALVGAYFVAQVLPLCLVALIALRYNKLLERLLEGKRKATLQRRGLFDFVSPFTVFLAVLGYFLYVAYVFYIAQNPFSGFAGPLINISGITLLYAVSAFVIYKVLYRKKVNPYEPHSARVHTISVGVKACVYICIAEVVDISLNFTLVLLDLQRWEPFGQSIFMVFATVLVFMVFTPPTQRLGALSGRSA